MTAIHTSHVRVRTTAFERALLDLASNLERMANDRAVRRGTRGAAAGRVQDAACDARAAAQARGSIGILPR